MIQRILFVTLLFFGLCISAQKPVAKPANEYAASMTIYPDFAMMAKIEDAARDAGIKCDMHWEERPTMPNRIKPIEKEKADLEFEMPKTTSWKYYLEALEKVRSYTNDKGIIKDNAVTKQRYLEVYSWDYMLSKAKADEFAFARKMKEKNMLDCYVFLSCFHYDFYDQYLDFIAANKDKVKEYFALLNKLE